MYVGSIVHPNQGVPLLIDALPQVFAAVPEARCVLVGGPAEAGENTGPSLAPSAIGSSSSTGQTPAQVVALTRRADVLVHPRLACRENYSVQSKIAVYLAAGRPIVATDFGDYQQLLGDTGAGLLTPVAPQPLAEAIIRVSTDPALATAWPPPPALSLGNSSPWTATLTAISMSTITRSQPVLTDVVRRQLRLDTRLDPSLL